MAIQANLHFKTVNYSVDKVENFLRLQGLHNDKKFILFSQKGYEFVTWFFVYSVIALRHYINQRQNQKIITIVTLQK